MSTTVSTHENGALLTVTFDSHSEATLKKLSSETGKSIPDLVADALALKEWVVGVQRQGEKIFLQGQDGTLREVTVK